MAVVSRVARIRIGAATGDRDFIATAAVQDTPAGGSVVVTVEHTAAGTPPAPPDTVELRFHDDAGAQISSVSMPTAAGTSTHTFHFTSTGAAGGAARCGTVEIVLRVQNNTQPVAANRYNIESDGSPNSEPVGFTTTNADRGWIRGTTTLIEDISNTSLGGAPNLPAAYATVAGGDGGDSLFVRLTCGAAAYVARALTVALTHGSVFGSTNSTTSAVRDVTFSRVVDNRFPIAATTVGLSVTVPNSGLTGQPAWHHSTTTDDTITVDPRLTVSVQAERDSTRSENHTEYVISADQLFVWGRCVNARGEPVGGVTLTQRIKHGAAVVATDSSAVTVAADGWTPDPGVDLTPAVAPPAGNRTQEAFPAGPADAVGLGTGTQTLGFASAYTAHRAVAVYPAAANLVVQYRERRSDGTVTLVAFDVPPTVRAFTVDPDTGTETDLLAATVATQIGATNSYEVDYTAAAGVAQVIEVRGVHAGGGVEAAYPFG